MDSLVTATRNNSKQLFYFRGPASVMLCPLICYSFCFTLNTVERIARYIGKPFIYNIFGSSDILAPPPPQSDSVS